MYYVARDNALIEWCDDKNLLNNSDEAKELKGTTVEQFDQNRDRYVLNSNILEDILGTEQYVQTLKDRFNDEFITTDKGCARIRTKWGNFLTILPNYAHGMVQGLPAGVLLLYNKPNFDYFKNSQFEEIIDWLVSPLGNSKPPFTKEEYEIFYAQVMAYFTNQLGGE